MTDSRKLSRRELIFVGAWADAAARGRREMGLTWQDVRPWIATDCRVTLRASRSRTRRILQAVRDALEVD